MTLEDTATASIRVLTIELPKFSHKSWDRRDRRLYRRGGRTTFASGRRFVRIQPHRNLPRAVVDKIRAAGTRDPAKVVLVNWLLRIAESQVVGNVGEKDSELKLASVEA